MTINEEHIKSNSVSQRGKWFQEVPLSGLLSFLFDMIVTIQ